MATNDGANGNWTYSYDPFNRLIGANKNSGQAVYSYAYDRFGNRWQQNGPNAMLLTFTGNNPGNPQNNNHMDGYSYDAAGNLLSDGVHSYTYDAESRITQVDGGATATYVYDANGQRVRKTTGGVSVDYLHDLGGREITEVSSSGGWNRGEVYAGGRHLATYNNSTTYFIHPDWLGTERVRTDLNAGIYESCTSLPFGDALSCSGGDPSPLHFTGKERDSESGLDYFGARYYSNRFGRWLSADWSAVPAPVPYANFANPQTLNLYQFVYNNSASFVDDNGHEVGYYYAPGGAMYSPYDKEFPQDPHPFLHTVELGFGTAAALLAPAAGAAMMVRFAPLLTSAGMALQRGREAVGSALEDSKGLKLSNVTLSRVNSALNSLRDHATDSDLKGLVREAGGVLNGRHADEVETVTNSLEKVGKSLQGALDNPNLSDETRAAYTRALQLIGKFTEQAKALIKKAQELQQK